jgi:integrase
VKLADLRPIHVERLRDQLLAESKLAPQTVGSILRVLSQALGRATARGLVARNVADASLVDRPAGRLAPFVVVTPQMAGGVLRAAHGRDPWDPAAALGLGAGLRREEMLALRWQDVDLESGTAAITRTLTFAIGRSHFRNEAKSEAGNRTVSLPGFRRRGAEASQGLTEPTTSALRVRVAGP